MGLWHIKKEMDISLRKRLKNLLKLELPVRVSISVVWGKSFSRVHYGTEICIKEAKTAFRYFQEDNHIDCERIGVLGHSMGGRIAF